ncbi:MAG: hypothetical protein ACREVY_13705 [Gammaproteobacteria bacterium]
MMNLPKEEARQMHGAYMAYTEAMKKAGAYVGNSRRGRGLVKEVTKTSAY